MRRNESAMLAHLWQPSHRMLTSVRTTSALPDGLASIRCRHPCRPPLADVALDVPGPRRTWVGGGEVGHRPDILPVDGQLQLQHEACLRHLIERATWHLPRILHPGWDDPGAVSYPFCDQPIVLTLEGGVPLTQIFQLA